MPKTVAQTSWQTERAGILLRICKWIEREAAKGKPVCKLIRRYSRRWDGKPFSSDASKRLRLSEASLKRIFYRWRKARGGNTFALHYCGSKKSLVPRPLVLEVLKRCRTVWAASLQSVINTVEKDWRKGKRIPGLKHFPKPHKARLPHRFSLQRICAGINFAQRRAILNEIATWEEQFEKSNFEIAQRAQKFLQKGKAAK